MRSRDIFTMSREREQDTGADDERGIGGCRCRDYCRQRDEPSAQWAEARLRRVRQRHRGCAQHLPRQRAERGQDHEHVETHGNDEREQNRSRERPLWFDDFVAGGGHRIESVQGDQPRRGHRATRASA